MSVSVEFHCNGCEATTKAAHRPRRVFVPLNSGGSLGTYRTDTIEDVAPEGWVAFDPFTGMTYCPTCWESIISNEPVAA